MQGDPWIQKSVVMEPIEVDLRRKAGSVPKSGRPEGRRLAVLQSGEPEGGAAVPEPGKTYGCHYGTGRG